MKTDWHELIQRYLADLTTAEETDTLQAALKTDANLRALYLDYMNLDVALGALAEAEKIAMPQAQRHARWHAWLPLAAAAGVALLLSGALFFSRKPSVARLDLTATFASTEQAIAHLPTPSLEPLPEWMSPTATMLDPTLLRPFNF